MTRISILILFVFLLFFSCSDEPNDVVIDPELQPYVDDFLAQASKRGIDIDLTESGLDMLFEDDISTPDYAGICRYKLGANEIGIDREVWNRSSEERKQWLIFHELGHCVLDRSHRNDKFENGMWKSLMRGDPLTAAESRIPLCYIWGREDYFIDELFDETIAAPDWIGKTFTYENGPERAEEIFSLEPETEGFDRFLPDALDNFEFEYTYWRKGGGPFANMLFGGSGNLEYHFLAVDHDNDDILIGNEIFSCIRFPFTNMNDNKVTVRQYNGTTSVFMNENFVHAFPSYKEPVARVRKTGSASIGIREFRFWSLN